MSRPQNSEVSELPDASATLHFATQPSPVLSRIVRIPVVPVPVLVLVLLLNQYSCLALSRWGSEPALMAGTGCST
jgi:hypothetical protein